MGKKLDIPEEVLQTCREHVRCVSVSDTSMLLPAECWWYIVLHVMEYMVLLKLTVPLPNRVVLWRSYESVGRIHLLMCLTHCLWNFLDLKCVGVRVGGCVSEYVFGLLRLKLSYPAFTCGCRSTHS